MKGIVDWINEIKENESFAKKFEGTKTVSEILDLAKKNGYEFSKRELMDLDLNSISGGGGLIDIKVNLEEATVSATVVGSGTAIASPKITMNIHN